MLPDFSELELALSIFVVPLTVQWWATWYPGSEPGGGSYIAQRMLAAQDRARRAGGHAVLQRRALRAAAVAVDHRRALLDDRVSRRSADISRALPHVDPRLLGNDMAYSAMLTFLPHGMLGVMVAGLLAAYVSTISTHLNWGTSYLVHDFYRRFMRANEPERHYVLVGRRRDRRADVAGGALHARARRRRAATSICCCRSAPARDCIYLLRWFWWRINAWSEIAAMASSFVLAAALFVGAAPRA